MIKDIFQFGAATSSRPGTGKIWNVEGDEDLEKNAPPSNNMYDDADDSLGPMGASSGDLSEEDTKILLEKMVKINPRLSPVITAVRFEVFEKCCGRSKMKAFFGQSTHICNNKF